MSTSEGAGEVLFLSATLGAGHHSAALAVQGALERMAPDLPTEELDFFDFVSPAFNRAIRNLYIFSVRHAPPLYELFYRSTGHIGPGSPFQRFLNAMGREGLRELIRKRSPRAVINTFPTPAGAISSLRLAGEVRIPNLAIVTDHTVHSQWIHPEVDRYYVGSEEIRDGMLARGVAAGRVLVTGIPVHPSFADPVDLPAVRRRWGIGEGPVVLLMAGAYGMIGGFDAVVARLVNEGPRATYIAIAGHDRALKDRLDQIGRRGAHPLLTLGYTREVAALMAVADILVSKAGGLTTSEAMARGLPMAIFRPIPGQERANARLVQARGAGFQARTTGELISGLHRVLSGEEERAKMADAARHLGRPMAAFTIAEDVLAHFC